MIVSGKIDEAISLLVNEWNKKPVDAPWRTIYSDALLKTIYNIGNGPKFVRIALESRRNEIESLLLSKQASFPDLQDWCSLNFYLGERDREISLIRSLSSETHTTSNLSRMRNYLVERNVDHFLDSNEFEILEPVIELLESELTTAYTSLSDKPIASSENEHVDNYKNNLLFKRTIQLMKFAIATNRVELAQRVAVMIPSLKPNQDEIQELRAMMKCAKSAEFKKILKGIEL